MNSGLPELHAQAAADEITMRTANHFNGSLLGIAVVAPWALDAMSITSGKLLWLTALDLIGKHADLLVMLCGYRDDNRP